MKDDLSRPPLTPCSPWKVCGFPMTASTRSGGSRFDVGVGEIVTLIGANGAGKSSILQAISGMLPVARGRVTLAGEDLLRVPAHLRVARGIAHVPEGRGIFGNLTVLENLRLATYRRRDGEIRAGSGGGLPASFPGWRSGGGSGAIRCPAASSRCWRWAGP